MTAAMFTFVPRFPTGVRLPVLKLFPPCRIGLFHGSDREHDVEVEVKPPGAPPSSPQTGR
jgi:hypothetical protein